MEVDENGWAVGQVTTFGVDEAWSLLSPEPEARIDAARLAHQARTFFACTLALAREKHYPSGAVPLADAVEIDVAPTRPAGAASRVLVVTVPLDRAPALKAAANAGVLAIGGAGMDAVVARGRRLWQVRERLVSGADARAPLAVAAIIASALLAPIVPPGGGTIFGVKGARLRLEALGWRT